MSSFTRVFTFLGREYTHLYTHEDSGAKVTVENKESVQVDDHVAKVLRKEARNWKEEIDTDVPIVNGDEEMNIETDSSGVQRVASHVKAALKAEKERKAELKERGVVEHLITDKDMQLNPDLAKEGIQVGQTIEIPIEEAEKKTSLWQKAKNLVGGNKETTGTEEDTSDSTSSDTSSGASQESNGADTQLEGDQGESKSNDTEALQGSSYQPATFTLKGGIVIQLGQVVQAAFEKEEITVEEWNALSPEETEKKIQEQVDTLELA